MPNPHIPTFSSPHPKDNSGTQDLYKFPNGYAVSVIRAENVFSCMPDSPDSLLLTLLFSGTGLASTRGFKNGNFELAIFDRPGNFIPVPGLTEDGILGDITPERVQDILTIVEGFPAVDSGVKPSFKPSPETADPKQEVAISHE